jgi:hypothetical protein
MLMTRKANHLAGIGNDHTHGLKISLKPGIKIRKGNETWRMNNTVINDLEQMEKVKRMLLNMQNTLLPVKGPLCTWLLMKKAVKGLLRREGVHKANKTRSKKEHLRIQLEELSA